MLEFLRSSLRPFCQALSLFALLITAQQGAVTHELSHVIRADGAEARSAASMADANCALCPAFAQVVSPAFSHAFPSLALEHASPDRAAAPRFGTIDATVLAPRSRGPPSSS